MTRLRFSLGTLLPLLSLTLATAGAQASTVHPFVGAPEDQALIDGVLADFFGPETPAEVLYVAPPDGSQAGTGTRDDPLRDLIGAVAAATAGTALYLEPGVYDMSQIRDLWGHGSSVLDTGADGTAGAPIIVSTDPERYDPAAGQVAVLDFGYDNHRDNVRTMSFDMSHDFWLVEKLELRNMDGRGIWLNGYDNVIRDNHMHHIDTDGTNNQGFILVIASGRPTNNVIMGNHFHHIGILDRASGEVTDYGGVNVACVYTETRQTYDTVLPDPGTSPTPQDYLDAKLPPDSHTYLYNNYGHHCAMGFATKNSGEGPYFFLSNVAHDVRIGIKNSYSSSVIRHNVIYAGAGDVELGTGISNGNANGGGVGEYFNDTANGHLSEIRRNTIVGAGNGVNYRSGWGVVSSGNLIVETTEGIHIHRNQFAWYDGGQWPGIRGEYILGDLNAAHPYYALMPDYVQALEGTFVELSTTGNCYDAEPIIAPADFTQPENDITGMVPDENYEVLSAPEVEQLFGDSEYPLRDDSTGLYESCGSQVSQEEPTTEPPDGGAPDGGVTDGGTSPGATPSDPEADDGCGCRTAPRSGGGGWAMLALAVAASAASRRRRSS